jgi:secretion/DNA translocation related TadE-like protein
VLGVLGALLVVAVGAFTLVGAVVASHRAHAAADLSALAGAAVLVQGQTPGSACAHAATVARRNDAVPGTCRASLDLSVEVLVSVEPGIPGLAAASARARAGPAPPATGR